MEPLEDRPGTIAQRASRKGNNVVRRLTAKERLARSLKQFNQQCRTMRHWPLDWQRNLLAKMLMGHYAYFGISGNSRRLTRLHRMVTRLWRRWLSRRLDELSQLAAVCART